MSGVLDRIVGETRSQLEDRKRDRPLGSLLEAQPPATAEPGRFREALAGDGIAVIAEFKRRSPSAGRLAEAPELAEVLGAYERGGAAAVSILTEERNFDGSLDDLELARSLVSLPLLRKDFIVDPYQLHEARLAGADAALLIVAALAPPELAELHAVALDLGLDPLVEVHDARELEVALEAGALLVGINNRDLRDFTVDLARTETLIEAIPAGVTVVSESGISDPGQLRRLEVLGVSAVLVGESLMRSQDPAAALRSLLAASA